MNKKIVLFSTSLLFVSQLLSPTIAFAVDSSDNEQNISDTSTVLPKESSELSSREHNTSLETKNSSTINQITNETSTSENTLPSEENDIVKNSDITISAVSDTVTSESSPLSVNNSIGYSISIKNNSISSYIPAGTTINFSLSSNSSIDIDKLLTSKKEFLTNSDSDPNLFDFQSATNGIVSIKTTENIYPGTKNFILYFYNPVQQYADTKTTIPVNITGQVSLPESNEQQYNFDVSPNTVHISVDEKSNGGGGVTTVPGYNDYGTRGNSTLVPNNYLSAKQNGYGLYNASLKFNDTYVIPFTTAFVKGIQGISNSRGVLWANADHPVPKENFSLILYSATGTDPTWVHTDISNETGINWSYTDTGASVDFSQWLSTNARFISNGGAISLITAVPVTSINDTVTYNGSIGWLGFDKWDGPTLKGMFKNPDSGSTIPYFRGSNSVTIFNTDNYDLKSDLEAYSGSQDISSSIEISDYNGYPINGDKPEAGIYNVTYVVKNDSNESTTFIRTITVLENKQSIKGSDYSMYVGDKDATTADFTPSATDKYGNALDVTADLSSVDFSKAGTYDILLSATDGQNKTVTLTIKENNQSITGSDYTMYIGDKKPTASDFNASATDKTGADSAVTVDLSKADLTKAGEYTVTITSEDGQTKDVTLTVLANKQTITGSDYSMYLGDKDATTADFNPAATDKDGNAIDVIADLSSVDFSKVGTYDVVLNATDGQTKTVQLTIKDKALVPTIEATDKTMYVGDTLTKEDILNWATFKNADGLEQGFSVVGTAIPVSAQDKLTTIGTYKINYYVQEKTRDTNEPLAQKEITLTVKEKKTSPKNPTDPSKSIGSGTNPTLKGTNNTLQNSSINDSVSSMNSAKSLPSTGEHSSPVWYVAGIVVIAMASGLFLWLKKTQN